MIERERDQALLSALPRGDRAEFEVLVDLYIQTELRVITSEVLCRAAAVYEDRCNCLPCNDGMSGLLFAAILRERAAALPA
jgi:hypothetical protein